MRHHRHRSKMLESVERMFDENAERRRERLAAQQAKAAMPVLEEVPAATEPAAEAVPAPHERQSEPATTRQSGLARLWSKMSSATTRSSAPNPGKFRVPPKYRPGSEGTAESSTGASSLGRRDETVVDVRVSRGTAGTDSFSTATLEPSEHGGSERMTVIAI